MSGQSSHATIYYCMVIGFGLYQSINIVYSSRFLLRFSRILTKPRRRGSDSNRHTLVRGGRSSSPVSAPDHSPNGSTLAQQQRNWLLPVFNCLLRAYASRRVRTSNLHLVRVTFCQLNYACTFFKCFVFGIYALPLYKSFGHRTNSVTSDRL